MSIFIYVLIIVGCCIVIWRASDGFEVASSYIGRHLTDGVRGATINAIGSSMPELFTTFWFLFVLHNKDGFAAGIGTTAGSAIFNGMIIPALVILAVIGYGLAKKVVVSRKVILRDGLSLIAAEIVLIIMIKDDTLSWWHGLLLMAVYGIYVILMVKTMHKAKTEESEQQDGPGVQQRKVWWRALITFDLEHLFVRSNINNKSAWTLLLFSMMVIGGACAMLVSACEGLAHGLQIHTYFVAVILASAATSVPDTVLSYRDAMDGAYDDAVANALGSNIFDVCFALGLPLFIYTIIFGPIQMSAAAIENVAELRIILLMLTILAFIIYIIKRGLGRIQAYLLLSIYIVFTIYILAKAYEFPWAIEIAQCFRQML